LKIVISKELKWNKTWFQIFDIAFLNNQKCFVIISVSWNICCKIVTLLHFWSKWMRNYDNRLSFKYHFSNSNAMAVKYSDLSQKQWICIKSQVFRLLAAFFISNLIISWYKFKSSEKSIEVTRFETARIQWHSQTGGGGEGSLA
jgi:hypothetical protein